MGLVTGRGFAKPKMAWDNEAFTNGRENGEAAVEGRTVEENV